MQYVRNICHIAEIMKIELFDFNSLLNSAKKITNELMQKIIYFRFS